MTNVFAEESLVTSHVNNVVNLSCTARGCSIQLSKLYDFRDSQLLFFLYVLLSPVIILHVEPLSLQKFLTEGQGGIRNACTGTWYTTWLRVFWIILIYTLKCIHSVHVHWSFLGGWDATFAKRLRIHESTRASLDHQVVLLRHNWWAASFASNSAEVTEDEVSVNADQCARDSGCDFSPNS